MAQRADYQIRYLVFHVNDLRSQEIYVYIEHSSYCHCDRFPDKTVWETALSTHLVSCKTTCQVCMVRAACASLQPRANADECLCRGFPRSQSCHNHQAVYCFLERSPGEYAERPVFEIQWSRCEQLLPRTPCFL